MLVESRPAAEFSAAKAARPARPVPRAVVGAISLGLRVLPGDLLVGDEMLWVALADDLENLLTIQPTSFWAGTSLKVMAQAAGGCVARPAERALDDGAAVDAGIEVLWSKSVAALPVLVERHLTMWRLFSFWKCSWQSAQ